MVSTTFLMNYRQNDDSISANPLPPDDDKNVDAYPKDDSFYIRLDKETPKSQDQYDALVKYENFVKKQTP